MNPSIDLIIKKIKEYDRILLFRHIRPDGDAIGATKGLKEILTASFPEKEIYLQGLDSSEQLEFMGKDDELIDEALYRDSLGIIIDCATSERVSNKKFSLCIETIRIDHHISVESYTDYEWIEKDRSSACEMIAEFYYQLRDELILNEKAAAHLYLGIVTDSGRFRFDSVSPDTLRLAGMLLEKGIDTETMYSNIYLKEPNFIKYDAYVKMNMSFTDNGVAWIYLPKRLKKKFGITSEDIGDAVLSMKSIKGSLIWIAFVEADKEIRVRLRSRFVAINELAEKYRGGGHAHACGATLYTKKELKALLKDADALIKEYKEAHPECI